MKHRRLETDAVTSKRMSNVRLKGGKAETILALSLWHQGYRYRKNLKKLPGSPDIALTKYKIAIFVDGEFWHGHDWENRKLKLKRNKDYWIEKIEENIARDIRNDVLLFENGWTPIHFWEKEVLYSLDECIEKVLKCIDSNNNELKNK